MKPFFLFHRRHSTKMRASAAATGRRSGYIFLISVLVIGAITAGMALTLILLGLAAGESGLTVGQTTQAYEYAQTCAERALLSLRADLSYDGGQSFTFPAGTCSILHTGGSGNADRALCLQGMSGRSTRRIEISLVQIYPRVRVASWREVDAFTLCP